jgi:uncharacterized membrane protein YhhN
MSKVLLGLLSLLLIADLYFISQGNDTGSRLFTKPFLIPVLITFYLLLSSKKGSKPNMLFVSGLVLSFSGDVFLLFEWGFIFGLASFLLAHILYIFSFIKLRVSKKYVSIPFILAYLGTLLFVLYPHLNEMKVPVIVYGITISTMLYYGLCSNNKWLIIGAFLFVISDSLLSFNLFVSTSLTTELLVMITYVFAQLSLVWGMLTKK